MSPTNPPKNRHTARISTSPLPNQLPAKLTVPPLPPRIHKRIFASVSDDGVILSPSDSKDPAVLIRWGLRGKVEICDAVESEDQVELGGVLGIVRLWDAAYLVVFLPPSKPPTRIFPNDDPFANESVTHEVFTLTDTHIIPLTPEYARSRLAHLRTVLAKRAPKMSKAKHGTPSKRGLKWRLPWVAPTSTSTSATASADGSASEESEEESDTDSEDEFLRSRRASSVAPEADEDSSELPQDSPEARVQRRFSLGWGRFKPRLGKAAPKPTAAAERENGEKAAPADGDKTAEETAATADVSKSVDQPADADLISMAKDAATVKDRLDASSQAPSVQVNEPTPEDELAKPPLEVAQQPSSSPALPTDSGDSVARSASPQPAPPPVAAPQRRELETKILKQIGRELGSGEFYYSYDFDVSHTLQYKRNRLANRHTSAPLLDQLLGDDSKSAHFFPPSPDSPKGNSRGGSPISRSESEIIEPDVHVPLWRRTDRRFFWNEWLVRDFIDLGLHAFILPISQGWVQASTFSVPIPPTPADDETPKPIPVDIALISRRSKDRAGLRYQRRGIDHEGHVANFVETEMIIRAKVEGKVSLFSFVQTRGSIPLKWSQTPWSMKPPPVLDQPVDETYSVANLHFDDLKSRYGPVTIINLSEQTGKEAPVTNGYTELVEQLDRPDLSYVPFDFHTKCHGLDWSGISELVHDLDFDKMGYMWALQGDVVREQKGVFRTNCIDCLDRTNVVQSNLARHVLLNMLLQLGIVVDPATSNLDSVFNDIWANNGDMISLCYAHTSALKGDFVRTGKRDLSGMLHDGVSSLSRMFYGAVSDFFAQAVISFMLGHRNLGVFNEFIESLQTTERSALIKQSRIRAAAIETSAARVLSDGESKIAGWTFLSPDERNIKLSPDLEEKVLLLTKEALYVVSFNYSLEKVNEFTRIPLLSITSIQKGAYILSALQEAGRDPIQNAGFVVNFSPTDESTRYSTYSIRARSASSATSLKPSLLPTPKHKSKSKSKTTPATSPSKPTSSPTPRLEMSKVDPLTSEYFAFKALPREFMTPKSSNDDDDEDDDDIGLEGTETCAATVDRVTRRIREQCARLHSLPDDFVHDEDVVSVAEAQSATSLLDRMDYAWKRFLWL